MAENNNKCFCHLSGYAVKDAEARKELEEKIATTELEEAVNSALAKAKESGEFDGEDGTSVTVANVSESSASGGTNVVTFSDNKKIHIKNGKDGKNGTDYVLTDSDKSEIADLVIVDPVPDFIIAEAEKVAKEIQEKRNSKSLVFPVMTDIHLDTYSTLSTLKASMLSAKYGGMGVKELRKRINLDFVAYLGDYTSSPSTYTAEQVKKDFIAFKETTDPTLKQIWCVGNHDMNYGAGRDRVLTPDEIYNHIGANSHGVKPFDLMERGYGYLDFENHKIRVIYLNTCDTSDPLEYPVTTGITASSEGLSDEQLIWFNETALDFSDKEYPSKWGIVILSHHPLHYGYYNGVLKILEGYKSSGFGTVTHSAGNVSYNVEYNFTNLGDDDKAEIICNIHGHNHNCASSKISSSSGVTPWLWRFCIPNLCVGRENECATSEIQAFAQKFGEFDENGNPVYYYKETGTAKATSFCVINIDRKNSKIYAHTFGAGVPNGREFNYKEEYVPSVYTITVTPSYCSTEKNPGVITEGTTETLTFKAINGYKLPDSVTVTGASHSWNKDTGTLTITNPTGNVSVTITAVEDIVVPSYNNLLDEYGTVDGYISSSSGNPSTKSGYKTTGHIPINYGSANNARGEIVLHLKNIDIATTDSSCRVGVYMNDANKTFIQTISANVMVASASDTGDAKAIYTLGSDGFIATIDLTGITSYMHRNLGKTPGYIRLCAKGIDGDSILTLNETID